MRAFKIAIAAVLLLVLTACGGNGFLSATSPDRLKTIEGIQLFNDTGALTARGMLIAARSGVVSSYEVCEFEQWSGLAKSFSDAALQAAIRDDLETAKGQMEAAQEAIRGIGASAQQLVIANCAGEEGAPI